MMTGRRCACGSKTPEGCADVCWFADERDHAAANPYTDRERRRGPYERRAPGFRCIVGGCQSVASRIAGTAGPTESQIRVCQVCGKMDRRLPVRRRSPWTQAPRTGPPMIAVATVAATLAAAVAVLLSVLL